MSTTIPTAIDQLVSQFTPLDQIPKIHRDLRLAFLNGVTKTIEWRTHQLKQLGYLLQENGTLFEQALAADLGKPKTESHLGELFGIRHEIVTALQNLKSWMEPKSVKTELTWLVARPKTYQEPKGLVLIIAPWNYPLALSLNPLVGAIAGGNTAILKLSEQAPEIANLLIKLIPQYLDQRHIRLVNGAIKETTALLDLHFDHIFFTGSTTVGKIIAKRAAETLTPVTLELGGKSPAIVFDDANFEVIGRRLVWGKTLNAGQTCVAPDYILVSKKNEEKLIDSLKRAIQEFYPIEVDSTTTNKIGIQADSLRYSKIINSSQFKRLQQCLSETRGQIVPIENTSQMKDDSANEEGTRMPLTLVRSLSKDDPLMQNEIFGPIFPILTYDPDKESIQDLVRPMAETGPLAIYVFTQTSRNFELVRQYSKSGQIVQNDVLLQFSIPGLPFGGGSGNYHGYHSFLTFTYERASANLSPYADALFKNRYPPYTPHKLKLLNLATGPAWIKGKSNPAAVPTRAVTAPRRSGLLHWCGVHHFSPLKLLVFIFAAHYFSRQRRLAFVGRWVAKISQSIRSFKTSVV